jgi:hypothetical protein
MIMTGFGAMADMLETAFNTVTEAIAPAETPQED